MTDVGGVGSQVVGIAGMGIGLGILAHSARGVLDTMYPYSRRRRQPVRQTRARRRTQYYPPRRTPMYPSLKPRYAWR